MKKNTNYILLLSIGIANSIVLYLAAMFFPAFVVLGNSSLSAVTATVITGFLLSGVMALPEPVMKTVGWKTKNELLLALVYLIFNVVGLWVLARLANYIGFGVTSFVVVIVLGFILNMLQYGVWKVVTGKKINWMNLR